MSNKKKRLIFFLLTITSSFIIPIIVVAVKYDIIEQFKALPSKVKVSMIGMIIILGLSFAFYKKLKKFLNKMEFSIIKHLVFGLIHFLILVSVLFLLIGINAIIEDVVYVFKWIVSCNIPSLFVFEPMWEKYNYLVQREIRVGEIREGVGR